MYQVDDLDMAYQGHYLFKGAKFTLQAGERCGLVGRNGSGKSTLFRLMTRQETPDGGSINLPRNYRVGVLDQHIRFKEKTLIGEACLGLPKGEEDCIYKAETILFGLGFKEEDLEKEISNFSGGYQLRLHLAKVLISEPDCLLLDEPTNYLDIVSIRWFTRFLQNWKGEFILISHDREFMDSVTTHTMGIHRQKIRKCKGSTIDFYEQLMQEEEIHEKTRQNVEKKRSQAQEFIDRFGAKASKAAQAQSRQKMLSKIPILEKLKNLQHLDFNFNTAPFPGRNMFEAKDIDFSYDGSSLINKLSLSIEKGEKIAILGKNGRGKSTILRLLAKDLEPTKGVVKHSDNLQLGYFGQTNIDRLTPEHTVEEEISLANRHLNRTEVKGICGLMMFSGDMASKPTSLLSGGEKSRVLLGKIIAKPCNLLLLDEPTHHLDMESIEALIDALESFEGSVILVTHSELILKRLEFTKIIVCHRGRQEIFLGNYSDFLEKDGWHDKAENAPSKSKEKSAPPEKKPQIEKFILQKEGQISELEEVLEELNVKLSEAVLKKDQSKIGTLSIDVKSNQQKISQLQKELESLFEQL